MPSPLAYFLTWTTYGTWLHGDERGSIDRMHNRIHTPPLTPNESLRERRASTLAHESFVMGDAERAIVDHAIREHTQHAGWTIAALNVRTNHVHAIVRADIASPEQVLTSCKAWATRRLREAGLIESDRRVWTTHGSTRWLNDENSFAEAVKYVLHGQ